MPRITADPAPKVGKGCQIDVSATILKVVGQDKYDRSFTKSMIEDRVSIGAYSKIGPGIHIDEGVIIGSWCRLSNMVICANTKIGNQVSHRGNRNGTLNDKHTTIYDDVVIEDRVKLYDQLSIRRGAVIKERTEVPYRSIIGENVIYDKDSETLAREDEFMEASAWIAVPPSAALTMALLRNNAARVVKEQSNGLVQVYFAQEWQMGAFCDALR